MIIPYVQEEKEIYFKKIEELKQIYKHIQSQSDQQSKIQKFPKTIVAIILFFVSIAGFLFAVYPRISVYPGESLDPHSPLSTPFIIKNDGYLSLRDIHYSLTPKNVKILSPAGDCCVTLTSESDKVRFVNPFSFKIPELEPNNTTAIFLEQNITTVLNISKDIVRSADININVTFKTSFVPYTFSKKYKFVTNEKKTGEYIWLEDYSER